jgi:hypothetical protein
MLHWGDDGRAAWYGGRRNFRSDASFPRMMSPISRVIGIIVLLVLLSGPAGAQAKTQASKRRPIASCAIPRGAQLVAQNSKVRIIALNNPSRANPDIEREWRYCLRVERGRFRTLVDAASYLGGLGDIVDVGPIVLAGAYVAYNTETTASGGRYGNNPVGVLYVRNLATGKSKSDSIDCGLLLSLSFCALGPTDYYCSTPFCGAGPPVLILSSNGVAAWEAEQKCIYQNAGAGAWRPCAWAIQVLDGRTGWQAVLDRLPPSQGQYLPDPFANLRVYECTAGCSSTNQLIATWADNGVWHSGVIQ